MEKAADFFTTDHHSFDAIQSNYVSLGGKIMKKDRYSSFFKLKIKRTPYLGRG
jgi:hypothetical protein